MSHLNVCYLLVGNMSWEQLQVTLMTPRQWVNGPSVCGVSAVLMFEPLTGRKSAVIMSHVFTCVTEVKQLDLKPIMFR